MLFRFPLNPILLALFPVVVLAETSSGGPYFDDPVRFEAVNCYTFGTFMVKEFPTDGIGTEKLSIVPKLKGGELCSVKTLSNEFTVDHARVRNGLFLGAKNGFIFFADHNIGNSLSYLAVYDLKTRKFVFEDTVYPRFKQSMDVPIRFSGGVDSLSILYARAHVLSCLIDDKNPDCLKEFQKISGLTENPSSVCKKGYKEAMRFYKGNCEKNDRQCEARMVINFGSAPSIVSYPVQIELGTWKIKRVGEEMECWPSE